MMLRWAALVGLAAILVAVYLHQWTEDTPQPESTTEAAPPASSEQASADGPGQTPAAATDESQKKGKGGKGGAYPRLSAEKHTSEAPLWKASELALHDGSDRSRPLLMAILGEVYDVGPGERFYGPKGGYRGLSGKDASRAMSTGEFDSAGAVPGVEGLDNEAIGGIVDWRKFYREHQEYRFVGYLDGTYYGEDKQPTPELLAVEATGSDVKNQQEVLEQLKNTFKSCNSNTQADPDVEIWCDAQYHGPGTAPVFAHLWVGGLPKEDQPEAWCACLNAERREALLADAEELLRKRIGGHKLRLVSYPECAPGQSRCRRPKDAAQPAVE